MYVRPPKSANDSRLKIPDNYGGNAFNQSGMYSDMPPPARPPHQRNDIQERSSASDYPREERYTSIPDSSQNINTDCDYPDQYNVNQTSEGTSENTYSSSQSTHSSEAQGSSIFSSLLPRASSQQGFPFGHGIGGEELLILGMMLLVYLSGNERGNVDNEFILLLGLLLFAG